MDMRCRGYATRSGLRMAPFRRSQPMDSHCRRGRLCCRSSRSCVGPPVSRHRLLANGAGRREARLRCLGTADGVDATQASDCAADALEPEGEWNAYLQAISGFMNGAGLEQTSVADYTAYDAASTGYNWRTPAGYGTVVAASLPHPIDLRLSTPVQSIELDRFPYGWNWKRIPKLA